MRQSWGKTALFSIFIIVLGSIVGCGGHKTSAVGPIKTITLSPNPSVSLNSGDVLQMTVQAVDASNRSVLNQPFTFTSSNPAIQIANNGLLCAGTWDSLTTPVVCTRAAATAAGMTANLTVTAQGITSNTVVAYVHLAITSLMLVPSTSACVSQGGTVNYTPVASNNGTDITASVGTFNWSVTNSNVGTPPSFTTTGAAPLTVTAKFPGQMQVTATANTVNKINSLPAVFTECPVASIVIGPAPVNFSKVGSTQQMAATVTDTLGAAVAGEILNWNANQAAIVSVNSSGLATAVAPGVGNIVASCTPNTCNVNLNQPVYSNVVSGLVPGATATTVYAAGTGSTSLVPITTATNTVGTAITLPQMPNSLKFAPNGNRAFLGSAGGLMAVDATNNTLVAGSPITNVIGQVLTISPDSNQILVSSTAGGTVAILNVSANSVSTFSITNAIAAEYAPDSLKAFVLGGTPAGSTMYVIQPSLSLGTIALPSAATDLSILASGPFAYLAATGTPRLSTCSNAVITAPAAPGGSPTLVKSLPDGSQILGAESGQMDAIPVTVNSNTSGAAPNSGCQSLTDGPLVQRAFGSAFTPFQIIVTPDSKHAYVTSNLAGALPTYDVVAMMASTIPISGGVEVFSGGSTADSASVYLGAGDQRVHVINVSTGIDTATIPIGFVPDLVAVRPH